MKQNNNRIKVVGVTGGVGSGKSVVMRMLEEEFGARIILADLVAHDLMEPGAVSYKQIVDHFGTEILASDGTIDRPSLSQLVFSDQDKLSVLNQITHPNVKKDILSRIETYQKEGTASLIAVEAALLIEEGYQEFFDEMWFVYVDEDTRIRRLMEGRGYSEEKSRSIMEQQLGEEEFVAHCDKVIDNNRGLEELRAQLQQSGVFD